MIFGLATSSVALIAAICLFLFAGASIKSAIAKAFRWVFAWPGRIVAWNHRRKLRAEQVKQARLATKAAEEELANQEIWSPGGKK